MKNAVDKYRDLRDEIDRKCSDLAEIHKANIVCKPYCCGCCVNLTVFPVEFYSILGQLKQDGVASLGFDESDECGFLKDGLCAIYPYRPMICRTHGLPIAFLDEQMEEYSVSFCEKNFTNENAEELEFGPESTLNIDELNYQLYDVNSEFVAERGDVGLDPLARIELKELVRMLAA